MGYDVLDAIIGNTRLGFDEQTGNFTFEIFFSVVWQAISGRDPLVNDVTYSSRGAEAIGCLLETVGVRHWENLKATPCRIQVDHAGKIKCVGHKDLEKWFSLEEIIARPSYQETYLQNLKEHLLAKKRVLDKQSSGLAIKELQIPYEAAISTLDDIISDIDIDLGQLTS